jgi:hypothetical protein
MRKLLLFFGLIMLTPKFYAQEIEVDFDAVDSLYREDQFFVNVSYASLHDMPDGMKQNKFSPSLSLGFLRDMPINKARTWSIAPGLGYSIKMYNQNLIIDNSTSSNVYYILPEDETLTKSRLTFHTIDLPIEIRWRNSTPETYKFWRVYTGFKVSYVFANSYKLQSSLGNYTIKNNKDLNDFQYGAYLTVGWNTVNLYAYYGLNSYFKKEAKIGSEDINLSGLHLGLMFYIL